MHQSGRGSPYLNSVPSVTNEVVLDLYRFLNQRPECTFLTLTRFFSEKWPIKTPPTVRQSVLRLVAKLGKLKKQPNSTEKDLVILRLLNDEYSPPCVFMVKGELRCSQPPTTVNHTLDNEILRTVNQDLCRELELKTRH